MSNDWNVLNEWFRDFVKAPESLKKILKNLSRSSKIQRKRTDKIAKLPQTGTI